MQSMKQGYPVHFKRLIDPSAADILLQAQQFTSSIVNETKNQKADVMIVAALNFCAWDKMVK